MPYHNDKIEFEDVLDGYYDEDFFPNHGKVLCVKSLNPNCQCLRCKPRERRYWRISKCKHGPNPSSKMDEDPQGCIFLKHPNDFYCKPYCNAFDARIKAKAFKEVYGYRGRLSVSCPDAFELFKETFEEADRILGE